MDRVMIVRVVYESSAKIDCNAIDFSRMDSTPDSISTFNDGMINILLVENFGSRDASGTCTYNDNIMNGCLYILGQCCEYYSQK